MRIEPRRRLVGGECILLTQHAGVHRAQRDPVLRIFGFDLEQFANGGFGLGQPTRREQRVTQAALHERHMFALLERMPQQPLGVDGLAGGKREGSVTAQRRHVGRIGLKDVSKYLFCRFTIIGYEGGSRFLDAPVLRIGEPGALIGHLSVRIFLEIDQHIAVGAPRRIERGHRLHH